MAAPVYTTDLADWIADADTAAWGELTNAASGGVPDEADTESALQGTNTVSQSQNTTALCSMLRVLGSPVTFSSGQVALVWHGHGVATALATYANNGLRVAFAGNALGNWKSYTVAGGDTPPFPYGKWVNSAVDPTLTPDATNGTPPTGGTNIYGVGSMSQLTQAVAKGQPHVCDIIRYGRAEARINGGDLANGYATFTGFAAVNDTQTNRWGLIQSTTGGYLWKGLMVLGYTSAVDFRTSNVNVYIQDCRKVSASFNRIEIRQATSRVDWTNVTLLNASPSTTASKGQFAVIDNADVNLDSCTFVDMDTFVFLSNSAILDSTFRRCGQITAGGALFTGCLITNSTAAVAAVATTTDLFTDCTFVSDGTGHAIDLGTISSTTSMDWEIVLSGYAASNGSTGNEALKVNVASGQTLTINVVTGYSTPSVYNTGTGTVTIVSGSVTATLTVTSADGAAISGAKVLVKANTGGSLPVNVTVTITNSGTTATVSHTGHAMLTGDKVVISGASLAANNGVFSITKLTDNSYSYTMGSTPGSNPTGTIKSTYVLLSGDTDANGQISMSRSFATNQPVIGWARKSTSSPYYKQGSVTGTVNTGTGASLSAVLVADE